MTSRSIEALQTATRQRRESAEKAVADALRRARKAGNPVTFTAIAAAAGVSTDFIYRHPDFRSQVEALRNVRAPGRAPAVQDSDVDAAGSTLIRRLSQELVDQRKKFHSQIADLEQALAAAHGELLAMRRQVAE